jgi:3-deoxy-D-manno-octulosonate 8-phosphate phosphatase (KDO 8-P phosphatase)
VDVTVPTDSAATGVNSRARGISLLVLDVDGVLTNGAIVYGQGSDEIKSFHTHDGLGIRLALKSGLAIALVTGRSSAALDRRAAELGIELVMQGVSEKLGAVTQLANSLSLQLTEVAFVGDDLIDLPAMVRVGLAIAVADAVDEVRAAAQLVTVREGGRGAVREAIEFILKAKGAWGAAVSRYADVSE